MNFDTNIGDDVKAQDINNLRKETENAGVPLEVNQSKEVVHNLNSRRFFNPISFPDFMATSLNKVVFSDFKAVTLDQNRMTLDTFCWIFKPYVADVDVFKPCFLADSLSSFECF